MLICITKSEIKLTEMLTVIISVKTSIDVFIFYTLINMHFFSIQAIALQNNIQLTLEQCRG